MAGFYVISCDDAPAQKTMDAGRFTIQTPSAWTLEELQGYDSSVKQITINDTEKISIDVGWYADNLNVDPVTHEITTKTIDNFNAKIVRPINFNEGITGVYFETIDLAGTKLHMSGTNLSAMNQRIFLNAIETLNFK